MAKTLVVNNNTFSYPDSGDDPGWGGEATAWAVEVTRVINNLSGPDDILQSTATINNNVTVAASVTGLLFDPTSVRSAIVEYSIYRRTDTAVSGLSEHGELVLLYDNDAPTDKWKITRQTNSDAGIEFDINQATGQITYTSTDVAGANYSGIMKFRARTLAQ